MRDLLHFVGSEVITYRFLAVAWVVIWIIGPSKVRRLLGVKLPCCEHEECPGNAIARKSDVRATHKLHDPNGGC